MNPELFKTFFPENIRAVFTDTQEDFVLPPEAVGLSDAQKIYLRNKLEIDPAQVFTMRQVHGNTVLTVTAKDVPQQNVIPEADALVTDVPGIVLSARTADCLPVFLYDPKKKCVGLVHAGWKGSALKIVAKTVEAMKKNYGSHPADLFAAFGPAIRECCYEVGAEFEKTFPNEILSVKNKRCLNLPRVNYKQLLKAGLTESHILDAGFCTVCDTGFFSHRRDKEKSGRHLSVIFLKVKK